MPLNHLRLIGYSHWATVPVDSMIGVRKTSILMVRYVRTDMFLLPSPLTVKISNAQSRTTVGKHFLKPAPRKLFIKFYRNLFIKIINKKRRIIAVFIGLYHYYIIYQPSNRSLLFLLGHRLLSAKECPPMPNIASSVFARAV